MKRYLQIVLTALLLGITFPSNVWATSIVTTSPTAGSVLSIAPTAVTIKASADLATGANEMTVTDAKGVRVDDGSLQVQGAVLMVGLKPLTTSGLYTVAYTLMAIDQPPMTGSFTFLYNAPGEIAVATPAPATEEVLTKSPNRITDFFVIGLMVFAFLTLIFLSRYARKTFKTPAKSRQPKKNSSSSKKIVK
ncbi:MAG: copper resistance protein CopC [Actinobacteria bacterium]|nr:copper resistance protein CopC [Actinomycetota bacterium]